MGKWFRYFSQSAEDGSERELTRDELADRLDGNVHDVELAISSLEFAPGDSDRLTDFSFFRAERKEETEMEKHDPPNDVAEKCLDALDAADAADRAGAAIPTIEPREPRIGLDEDDQADDVRIVHRFPIYIQHLLARQITLAQHFDPPLSIADLDRWTDDELAVFANNYTPSTHNSERERAYLRILAVALRHFQTDPVAVRGAVVLVGMISRQTKTWTG